MQEKIVPISKAIKSIQDGDTIAINGFVGIGTPEELVIGLETRFLETGSPSNVTLTFAAAPGDAGERGLNRLAHKGLVGRAIGGHWSLVPKIATLAVDNEIEAYNLPLGCISQLYRAIAAQRPGMLSRVGVRTFVDPRLEGGRINARTLTDLVKFIDLEGEEYLFYKTFPINVCFIRGTTADPAGNVTMEREAVTLDALPIAMATRNSGGTVIVQVEQIAERASLNPRNVQIPGELVDYIVVASPENHDQTYATHYSSALAGQIRVPVERIPPLPLDERKIIARRAAMELPDRAIINLGIGMPEGVASVAAEENVLNHLTLTTESGVIGGFPQGGLDFGSALNASAVIPQNQIFDFYEGGGLNLAVLGMAQVDAKGNVNVSRFNGRLAGAGGFINISQNARKIIFCGTFTAGGLKVSTEGEILTILNEGKSRKFIKAVEQITFSGDYARHLEQDVLYVTERCVLSLGQNGMELIEVAPGIDIEKDILAHMDFKPIVHFPRLMDERLFKTTSLGLARIMKNNEKTR